MISTQAPPPLGGGGAAGSWGNILECASAISFRIISGRRNSAGWWELSGVRSPTASFSSAMTGCLGVESVSDEEGRTCLSLLDSVTTQPTPSTQTKRTATTCGPMCGRCSCGHACLRQGELESRTEEGLVQGKRTLGSRLFDARGLADVDGKVRLLPVVVVSGRRGAGQGFLFLLSHVHIARGPVERHGARVESRNSRGQLVQLVHL